MHSKYFNKLSNRRFLLSVILLAFCTSSAQNTNLDISARVDSSKTEVKQVYELYSKFLNSTFEVQSAKPYWNKSEVEKAHKLGVKFIDNSSNFMFSGYSVEEYFSYNKPKVLQIDKIDSNRFQIKTIFTDRCETEENKSYKPDCITKLYAVRDENGSFKLENTVEYDTRNWKVYKFGKIKFIVHPSIVFNKTNAKKGKDFCNEIIKRFKLDEVAFTYYITSNSDELGKLFNFEYLLSYVTGCTNDVTKEIFTSYSNEANPHEFIHLLFSNSNPNPPRIIKEGLATWLGGLSFDSSFKDGLKKLSSEIKSNKDICMEDIVTFKYKNPFDNNVLYLTGGVICQKIYDKHGVNGIMELYKCPDDTGVFKQKIEKLLGLSYKEIDTEVLDYIRNYSN